MVEVQQTDVTRLLLVRIPIPAGPEQIGVEETRDEPPTEKRVHEHYSVARNWGRLVFVVVTSDVLERSRVVAKVESENESQIAR